MGEVRVSNGTIIHVDDTYPVMDAAVTLKKAIDDNNTFVNGRIDAIETNPLDHLAIPDSTNVQKGVSYSPYVGDGYIEKGLTMELVNDTTIRVKSGSARVNGKQIKVASDTNFIVPTGTPSLIALDDSGTVSAVSASKNFIDANTVAFWDFSNWDGVSSIPNSAVGVNGNTIAVANDLVKTGTVNPVDGWIGKAAQGDGNTGYLTSANYTGFSTGAAEREYSVLLTIGNITTTRGIVSYGVSGNMFEVRIVNARVYIVGNTNNDTGFDVEVGKTYLITPQYDGTSINFKINGTPIYSVTQALNTTVTVVKAFCMYDLSSKSGDIIHYIEIRNKMRTTASLGTIANKLCLPCSYTGYSASYPTISDADKATAWHEWKFDETSGANVGDSAGTLNGTATGTQIVDSLIGLGKARKFNGTSDYVQLSSFTWPSEFTIIYAGIPANSVDGMIISNYQGTAGNGSQIRIVSGGFGPAGEGVGINYGVFNTAIMTSKSNTQTYYINSPNQTTIGTATFPTNSFAAKIGTATWTSGYFYNGIIDYLAIIPRALSQPEIALIYNALMKQGNRNIISDMIPSNGISLGRILTGSYVKEIKHDYQFGRREGVFGGNRRVFLGYKYYSGSTILSWNNPFSTRRIKTIFVWAQDSNGLNESDIISRFDDAGYFGIQQWDTCSQRISIQTMANGVTNFNGGFQTSGYIGCYAEVLE